MEYSTAILLSGSDYDRLIDLLDSLPNRGRPNSIRCGLNWNGEY